MKESELLKTARVSLIGSIAVEIAIKDGKCKLSTLELLELFSIIKNWQYLHQEQVDTNISHKVRVFSQRWVDALHNSIIELNQVFLDSETEIISTLKKKRLTTSQKDFVKIFIDHVAQIPEFSDVWKNFEIK